MTPRLPPDVEPCPEPVYSPPLWIWALALAVPLALFGAGYAVGVWQVQCIAERTTP